MPLNLIPALSKEKRKTSEYKQVQGRREEVEVYALYVKKAGIGNVKTV